MKKVLLASTALLLTAGFASAQSIELSGDANAGLKYNTGLFEDEATAEDFSVDELTQHYEINMTIAGSGTTDAGLEFGAFLTADETGGLDDAEVFISGTFGTITMGMLDPATDGFGIADPGFDGIGMDDPAEFLKNATASADIMYSYSVSGLTFMATGGIDTGDYSVAATYDAGMFSAGIGYASADDDGTIDLDGYLAAFDPVDLGLDPDTDYEEVPVEFDNQTLSVVAGVVQGPFSANAIYSTWSVDDADLSANAYGIDISYDAGAAIVTGVYGRLDVSDFAVADDSFVVQTYGVGVEVPLGGGFSVAGGVGIIDASYDDGDAVDVSDQATVADLGVTMEF